MASWIIYPIQLSTFIVAALVLSLPIVHFRIVPRRRMWERAHAEAMHQFLALPGKISTTRNEEGNSTAKTLRLSRTTDGCGSCNGSSQGRADGRGVE
jgi:hypothetical protein